MSRDLGSELYIVKLIDHQGEPYWAYSTPYGYTHDFSLRTFADVYLAAMKYMLVKGIDLNKLKVNSSEPLSNKWDNRRETQP